MHDAIEWAARLIAWAGAAIIVWGILLAVFRFFMLEAMRFRGANICKPREMLRQHLGSYLLLGLEFLVAADIIMTILEPGLSELALLGALVAIRTVLNFFLNRELAGHTCPVGMPE
jgi:uncharacterized membrane protein